MPYFDMSRAVETPDVANSFFTARKQAQANALAEEQRVKGMQQEQLTKGLAEASWVLSGIPKDQISQSMPHFVEGFEKANGAGSWATADDAAIKNFASVGRARAAGLLGIGPEQFAPKPKTYQTVAPGNSLYAQDESGNMTLVATAPGNTQTKSGFGTISPSDFTPRSLARYKASIDPQTGQGDYGLLERAYPPQPGVSLMSPQQVTAAGLPTGTVAQVDNRGRVNVVSKPEGGGAPNGEERSAAAFGTRMGEAEKFLSSPKYAAYVPSTFTAIASQKSRSGGAITSSIFNNMLSQLDQSYSQYAQDWIRAKLRKESGAAIGDDEGEREYRTYFPMPGDTPETLEQKRQARLTAQQGFMQMAGRAAPSKPAPGGAPAGEAPAAGAQAPVRVRSLQEARALPPGTPFITPDGQRKVR